jgi:hypothetical protein
MEDDKDFSTLIKCIDYTIKFNELEEGWDSYNSAAINPDAIDKAIYIIIKHYKKSNILPYFISPSNNGGVSIEYIYGLDLLSILVDDVRNGVWYTKYYIFVNMLTKEKESFVREKGTYTFAAFQNFYRKIFRKNAIFYILKD